MFSGYLGAEEINELKAAAISGGLLAVPRQSLLVGLPLGYVAGLNIGQTPLDQFTLDVVNMNMVERMAGGEVPVVTYLQNATSELKLRQIAEAAVFERILNRISNVASGVPDLPDPGGLPEVVHDEKVIGFDDTLSLSFLRAGLEVARSVSMISVPRFENGQQVLTQGVPWVSRATAWLVAPQLALTNHHVVNARLAGEPDAAEADLRLQTSQSTLRFDFDNESADGLTVPVAGLRHFSKALDYALLDLVEPVDRPIPALSPELVVTNATSYVAVNVVQHPRGEHKQIALRNNLVSGADATTVRYLADTDYGSSGSPVCDDKWRVVALHRGATRASGLDFQGKSEAFVNYGSQIQAVLSDVRKDVPTAAEAIDAAQAH